MPPEVSDDRQRDAGPRHRGRGKQLFEITGDGTTVAPKRAYRKRSTRARTVRYSASKLGLTMFTASMALIFLLPLLYMVLTSFKDSTQITALNAPLWPAMPEKYTAADGTAYVLYQVPMADGTTAASRSRSPTGPEHFMRSQGWQPRSSGRGTGVHSARSGRSRPSGTTSVTS